MLHNNTLLTQPTELHQPMDWLGGEPNLTYYDPGPSLSQIELH